MTAATIPLPDPYIGIAAFVDFAVAVEPVLPVVVPVPEAVVEREGTLPLFELFVEWFAEASGPHLCG